jgi:hypothetical protein
MDPVSISMIAFLLAVTGILMGWGLRRMLPAEQLGAESKDAIKLGLGVVMTLSALVLGLLVASAKSGYDMRRSEINQITSGVILLDHLLSGYGDDAWTVRTALREEVRLVAARIWNEGQAFSSHPRPFKPLHQGELLYQRILGLQPSSDAQRELKRRIVQLTHDLAEVRLSLFSQLSRSIPLPFLIVLLSWIAVMFTGFAVMTPAKITPLIFLVISACSVSGAIFLVLELDQPFAGLMMIPDEHLLSALQPLN